MIKKMLVSLSFVANAGAYANPGAPHYMAVANTPEFPFNMAALEEIQMDAFTYDSAACDQPASVAVLYSGELELRIGTQKYQPASLEKYPNSIAFADADACRARDFAKLTKVNVAFQNTLIAIYQQVWEWNPSNGVVTFTSPSMGMVTSAGVVVQKY